MSDSDHEDFSGMSDRKFLAERKRVRASISALQERYRWITEELDRRAAAGRKMPGPRDRSTGPVRRMPYMTFNRSISDHHIVYGYAYGRLLMGHCTEVWLTTELAAWIGLTRDELRHRELLAAVMRLEEELFTDHQAHPRYSRSLREAAS